MSEPYERKDLSIRELEEQVGQLSQQVEDLQAQIFQLGNAVVQALTYSAHIAASLGASDELERQIATRMADEVLQQVEATLSRLPWAEVERPQLG